MQRASMQLLGATEYYIEWNHALGRGGILVCALPIHERDGTISCSTASIRESFILNPGTCMFSSAGCVISHLAFFMYFSTDILGYEVTSLYSRNPEAHSHAGFMGNACREINPWSCRLCFNFKELISHPRTVFIVLQQLSPCPLIASCPVLLRTLTLPSITLLNRIRISLVGSSETETHGGPLSRKL